MNQHQKIGKTRQRDNINYEIKNNPFVSITVYLIPFSCETRKKGVNKDVRIVI